MFSFGKELSGGDDSAIYTSSTFVSHAKSFVRMIDMAVNMLGPDLELLGESLQQLGAKHARYGVEPSHFIALGESLFNALEKCLKDAWSARAEEGWAGMYTYISTMMLRGVQDYNEKYGNSVGVEVEDAVQGTNVLAA
jgi:hemoglobin-like flavoprotein